MRPPLLRAFLDDELIVDNFAGGGGTSIGIEMAAGRSPDIAINHDPEAIAMHEANHPDTRHYCESVWDVDPAEACAGRAVALAWFSPDCKHFSKAKGGKPVDKSIRGLAWVVIDWAKAVRPRVIILENVEEFEDWGPLRKDGMPNKRLRGVTFRRWWQQLQELGYHVEKRQLRGCDYGAPTIRKRLFVIARCDGEAIEWPTPSHGAGLAPYRTAAKCIDWSIPCPSIFERKKPLADNTLRRIARGIQRYLFEAADPFIVPVTHQGDSRTHSIREPFRTITGANRGELALAMPTLIQTGYGERPGQTPRVPGLEKPLGTVVGGGVKHALVAAFLAKHFGGNESPGWPMRKPMSTLTAKDHHALVTSHLVKLYGTSKVGRPLTEPLPTITASGKGGGHLAEVRAFLLSYYGTEQRPQLDLPLPTLTTRHRFAIVTIAGQDYVIADIGMRMLQPRELFAAQGFPDDYQIAPLYKGKPLTKTAQVRMVGNSVCPPIATALVAANFAGENSAREAI